MAEEEVVESIDEMKKNMQRKKKMEAAKKEGKMSEMKEGASQKSEDVKEKAGNVKKGLSEKKESFSGSIRQMKEKTSDTNEDIKQTAKDVKDEASKQKEKLEKESKEEGMTPAEKILTDFVNNLKQRTGDLNDALNDRNKESRKEQKAHKSKTPLIDVLETNETIYIIADLPGVKKDDLDLGISKSNIEIRATFKEENKGLEDAKFIQKERSYGEVHRLIRLSSPIKSKEVSASFKNCTLTIKLPKTEKDMTKIEISD